MIKDKAFHHINRISSHLLKQSLSLSGTTVFWKILENFIDFFGKFQLKNEASTGKFYWKISL